MRPNPLARHALALALALPMSPRLLAAQVLEPGDIVVPGNHVVDSFGNVEGCIYRIRGGAVTRHFQTNAYRTPRDMMVDEQGRLVFMASPLSRNIYDSALFRIDPATGVLERLWYFPAYVQPGDTLPQGASSVTEFGGGPGQSLHAERALGVRIVDDENGGWPQVVNGSAYGFSVSTLAGSQPGPRTYRFHADAGRCETGVATDLLPWSGPVHMASDGGDIYYGLNNLVGRTGTPLTVDLQLDGSWGSFGASLTMPPRNELVITGHVFDNLRYPNGVADCGGGLRDENVPYTVNGSTFTVVSMSGLGVLDGRLYVTSSSSATGVPYVFDLAPRAPYLNPYLCQWDTAVQGNGPLDFNLPDGTPTYAALTSTDGAGLLGSGGGVLVRVTPTGGFQAIDASVPYTGRPWRWSGPGSARVAGTSPLARVLVVRVDSLAGILITDAAGRRLGLDSLGATVNDFGAPAAVLTPAGGGWPRVLVLRDPEPGAYDVRVRTEAGGAWGATAYLAAEDGSRAREIAAGTASGAATTRRILTVGPPAELHWFESTAGVPSTSERPGLVSVAPQPAHGEVCVAFRAQAETARARLEVFDLGGRRVATPFEGRVAAGVHAVRWDGRDATGRRLAPGVYLARLEVGGRRDSRRIVLAR